LLLVHGAADLSVKPGEAQTLYEASDKTKTELVMLDHVGHMYDAKHPFNETNPTIEHITSMTARWFHTQLG
jgi:dipeptidyl aminopeptidase/acylaminoacyl peptidase